MTCGSCVDKWTQYYVKKGFQKQEAEKLAKKLVKRIEKRLKKEKLAYEPLYLLEKAGEGVDLYYRRPPYKERFFGWLYRMVFLTNWRATFFWRRWIGRGYNPDYTQNCTEQGSCLCVATVTCQKQTDNCNCNCPSPLPNSSQVANNCVPSAYKCGAFPVCPCTCANPICSGTCSYNCNTGYTWNGVACVSGARKFFKLKPRSGDAKTRGWFRKSLTDSGVG